MRTTRIQHMKNSLGPVGSFFSSITSFISRHRKSEFVTFLIIALVASVGWGEYRRAMLQEQISLQTREYIEKISSTASSTENIRMLVLDVYTRLENLTNQSFALNDELKNQQNKNEAISEKIGQVSSTIGSLDKLSKTDPELLQKYSKVYFLNEHYVPPSLANIPVEFSFNKNITYQIHASVFNKLDAMLKASKADGVNLLVLSAYRSFGTQNALKTSYKVTYGAGTANQFSADQGYSEHQLATTLDFTSPKGGAVLNGFDTTPEFTWLVNNAHKYGFTLSYPKGNKYYVYEPWHWRYVGVDLATRLKREGKYFYDLDQRTIDNYMLLLFD